ncbi:MAG: hypothetical protein Q7T50_06120 [Candidatus Magasanikbacteria bacterium]|nr:hypothetical protein [Candidatus Magasanikbacteria bacterium]
MNIFKDKPELFAECVCLHKYLMTYGYPDQDVIKYLQNIFTLLQEGGFFTIEMINMELTKRNQAIIEVNNYIFQIILKIGQEHFGWKISPQSIN